MRELYLDDWLVVNFGGWKSWRVKELMASIFFFYCKIFENLCVLIINLKLLIYYMFLLFFLILEYFNDYVLEEKIF